MFNKIKDKLKGFYSKTEDIVEDDQEIESIQEEVLEDTSREEQEAIKNHEDLSEEEIEKNSKRVEEYQKHEETNEKETQEEIDSSQENNQETKKGFFSKTADKLKKKTITQDDFDKIWLDLEIFLLEINIAYEIVEKIQNKLQEKIIGNNYNRFQLNQEIKNVLIDEVQEILTQSQGNFLDEINKHKQNGEPLKIMMLGVNGTGKTTSIAKLIKYLQNNNLSVVVAAADTFRAAAVEQLSEHCNNLNVKCITHKHGSDPASVAYDATQHAKAKNIDVVLIDTAGRMPNNSNLMMELQKIKRVVDSQMAMFIGDSIAGNDLIDQISLFDKGITVDGVFLTKTDTDERPGSVVTTSYSIEKPIYFLGTGQNYEDIIPFDAKTIAEQLFNEE